MRKCRYRLELGAEYKDDVTSQKSYIDLDGANDALASISMSKDGGGFHVMRGRKTKIRVSEDTDQQQHSPPWLYVDIATSRWGRVEKELRTKMQQLSAAYIKGDGNMMSLFGFW